MNAHKPHRGCASTSKTAAEIYIEFLGNNQFPVAFIEVSKYSNDADNGAVSDYNLQNRFLEDSELDKRNYFMEELELHHLHEGDMIISNNVFNGGIKSKYLTLMFDNNLGYWSAAVFSQKTQGYIESGRTAADRR